LHEMQDRIDDYAAMGVKDVWIIDPWKRVGYHASAAGFLRPGDEMLRVAGTPIAVSLADIFAQLDEF